MTLFNSILLGIIQGLTEFLPVSSSGHLVLAEHFLGVADAGITLEVMLHFGTLLAVFVAFRKEIVRLLAAFFSLFRPDRSLSSRLREAPDLRLLLYLFLATLPAVVIGLIFKDKIEAAFDQPRFVAWALLFTSLLLALTFLARKGNKNLTWINTLIMGLAQALAILPGVSRSGSTISFGLFSGLRGEDAARFSFLLSIPAVLGATILKLHDMAAAPVVSGYAGILLSGATAAFLTGWLAIAAMLRILRHGKLYWFAPYCLLLGLAMCYLL
ncbi:MAG TPA: undecaprenyl-diphosphate phosphatase [bacterium]|nr:undecaprenyl-diphosphate phosphatase [bacterium]HQI49419.1 undecaprenyl-diphosphate phosphatase [bacterium]HQJ66231.1 undecaprenyl-diphosphate phosphatase [bacterium]